MSDAGGEQPRADEGFSRRKFLTRSAFLGLAVAGGGLLAACGDGQEAVEGDGTPGGEETAAAGGLLAEARERGSITVGIANEAPYGFEDDQGQITGEAPEVAREVLSRLGIEEMNAEIVDFGSLIPGINAGQFDLIAAGMFITPERCEQVLFSDPDYCAPQALGVPEGNPNDLNSYEDIANSDATLGVLSGAVEVGYAEAAGVPDGQITALDSPASMVQALKGGRIDAFGLTSISVRNLVRDETDLEVSDTFVPVVDGEEQLGCGGYGFREENEEFRDAFNEVLNEMKANDEILPIVEEFGFGPDEVSSAKDKTAEEMCQG